MPRPLNSLTRSNGCQTSHYILSANYQELKAIPERFETDRRLLNRSEQKALHYEFIRKLHNYLASVKTMVDHTRAFISRYVDDKAFDRKFHSQLQRLLENPVVTFIQAFYNPVHHSHLPEVVLTITSPEGRGIRHQLTVSVADLLAMYEWPRKARRYIESAKEGYNEDQKYLDIAAAAEQYQEVVTVFYAWFYNSIGVVKGPLIAEFVVRRTEIAKLQMAIHKQSSE